MLVKNGMTHTMPMRSCTLTESFLISIHFSFGKQRHRCMRHLQWMVMTKHWDMISLKNYPKWLMICLMLEMASSKLGLLPLAQYSSLLTNLQYQQEVEGLRHLNLGGETMTNTRKSIVIGDTALEEAGIN